MEKIKPNILGITFAILGLIFSIVAVVVHGLLGFPSFIELIYPYFWQSAVNNLLIVISSVVAGFILGYILAALYNWVSEKFR